MFKQKFAPFFNAEGDGGTPPAGNENEEKTFTQEQLNKAVQERLAREREAAAKKYGDYDELKAKAAELDKLKADQMSEVEKANKAREEALLKVAALEKTNKTLEINRLKTEACAAAGLSPAFADRLKGEDAESIKADAESLKAMLPKGAAGGAGSPSGANDAATLEKQYDDAMKAGKFDLAFSLKTKLFNSKQNK